MKTYPLTGPPSASGVYLIKNKTTGQIYVGQSVDLRRRYLEWRTVFSSGLGATNPALHEAIKNSNIEDWDFVVFELCEPQQLDQLENSIIEKIKASIGDKCINGTEPKIPREVTALTGSIPLSEVLDEAGAAMSYGQVAARCGVTPQAIKKRLAAWRRKGKNKISIGELL